MIPKVIKQFIQFAIIGGIGVFINLGITWALTEKLGIYYLISNFLGICVAMVCNFMGNKFWTFKGA
jgi:dolichol-phosphate mannosyltransferase